LSHLHRPPSSSPGQKSAVPGFLRSGALNYAGPHRSQTPEKTGGFGAASYQNCGGSTCYGSYVDELLSYTNNGTRYFTHSNHLYSPSAVTNAAGQVQERYRYDAYGKQTISTATGTVRNQSAIGFSRGFTGYILDEETGLYYARARMYSAGLGRFIGRDPLGYVDGYSVYAAYFSPNGIDPFGLFGDLLSRLGFRVPRVPTKVPPPAPNPAAPNPAAPNYAPDSINDSGWFRHGPMQGSNNCYAYATGDVRDRTGGGSPADTLNWPQPGNVPRTKPGKEPLVPGGFSCASIIANAKQDAARQGKELKNPGADGSCPCDYYKVHLMMTPDDPKTALVESDYHWTREDSDGRWSHKPGNSKVERTDPGAMHGYGVDCGYLCVPKGGISVR